MSATVRRVFNAQPFEWDAMFASEVSPAWEEDVNPHSEEDLYETWWHGIAVTDVVLAHGGDNGSGNLGGLLETAMHATHKPPVLVVVPDGEQVSKAWRGYAKRYRRFQFMRINTITDQGRREMEINLAKFLFAHLDIIEGGPARRLCAERDISAVSEPLRAGWRKQPATVKGWIADVMGEDVRFLNAIMEDSLLLAAAGTLDQMKLMNLLHRINDFVVERGYQVLSNESVRAWKDWSIGSGNPERAKRTMIRAVELVESGQAVVTDMGDDLAEPGAWAEYANDQGIR